MEFDVKLFTTKIVVIDGAFPTHVLFYLAGSLEDIERESGVGLVVVGSLIELSSEGVAGLVGEGDVGEGVEV